MQACAVREQSPGRAPPALDSVLAFAASMPNKAATVKADLLCQLTIHNRLRCGWSQMQLLPLCMSQSCSSWYVNEAFLMAVCDAGSRQMW